MQQASFLFLRQPWKLRWFHSFDKSEMWLEENDMKELFGYFYGATTTYAQDSENIYERKSLIHSSSQF